MNITAADSAAWNIAEGGTKEHPILIRYRPDLEGFIGHKSYSKRLVILWDFEPDNSTGMPSSDLSDQMKLMEDALVEVLDPDRLAILSFVLTKFGCREWHFYAEDIPEIGNRINLALAALPKLPLHLQVEEDSNWEELQNVYNLCGR